MDVIESTSPHVLIAYVKCSEGHPLPGLFILLRQQPEKRKGIQRLLPQSDLPFNLAMVDQSGYLTLLPTNQSVDPWPSFYAGDIPHKNPVVAGVAYEFYFIRHPSLNYAYKVLQELNGTQPKAETKDWPKPIVKSFEFHTRHLSGGDEIEEVVLVLDENPSSYFPKGSKRYDHLVLYRDMPHAECKPIKKNMKKLQCELGALRYVVGGDGGETPPYWPEEEVRDGSRIVNIETVNAGIFDSRTLNAVYQFQQDVLNGKAFNVNSRAGTIAKHEKKESSATTIEYLHGSPALPPVPLGMIADGVVNDATGDAIGLWHDQGLRNPHSILIALPAREGNSKWQVYMRPELAEALYAWRELTKALGFPQGIAVNHTYRNVLVDVGHAAYGRSAVSIHKTGLAVDVGAAKGFRTAAPDWPVVFTQDESIPMKEGYRILWRLFAVSTLQLHDDPGRKKCREALSKAAGTEDVLGNRLRPAATALLAKIESQGWEQFTNHFFRDAVQSWNYDPWDDKGGSPGEPLTAPADRATRLAEKRAALNTLDQDIEKIESQLEVAPISRKERNEKEDKTREIDSLSIPVSYFVDLTTLAELAGLKRIGSFTNKSKPQGRNWGLAAKKGSTRQFDKLAHDVAGLQESHGDLTIEITGKEVAISDIDAEFLKGWAAALPDLKLVRDDSPQVICRLSRDSKDQRAKKRVEEICSALEKFGEKKFTRSRADKTQVGETLTGGEWAAKIRAEHDQMVTSAPVNLKDGSQNSKRKSNEDWTYRLLPIFGTSAGEPIVFLPKTIVLLPDEGSPIGMEWWHFQVQDLIHGKWGDLLGELGWTKETACDQRIPSLHHREGAGYPVSELEKNAG
jgi:hypothetical protein